MLKKILLSTLIFFSMKIYSQDIQKYEQIENLLKSTTIIDKYDSISLLLAKIDNVNLKYKDENLLYILTRGNFKKNILDNSGKWIGYEDDTLKINCIKNYIRIILDKGFDKKTKSSIYNAPILFYIEAPEIFEFLCELGFDPNERLSNSFVGFPYFSLHSAFNWEIYEIAKKYGFNKDFKIPWENGYLTTFHRIISFSDFNDEDLKKICFELKSQINTPNPETGLSPLMQFIISRDLNQFTYNHIKILLDNEADVNFLAQNTNDFGDQRHVVKGMTVIDIVDLKGPNNEDEETKYWKEKTIELLNKY